MILNKNILYKVVDTYMVYRYIMYIPTQRENLDMHCYLITIEVEQATEIPAFCILKSKSELVDQHNRLSVYFASAFMGGSYDHDSERFVYDDGMHIVSITPLDVKKVTEDEADRFSELTNCRVYDNYITGYDDDEVNEYFVDLADKE